MQSQARRLVQSALIAAMYAAVSYLQNLLVPGSSSWAIQFRVSEALCVLAFFTPCAAPGLAVGCFLFNLTTAALPPDAIIGSLATYGAAEVMYLTRKCSIRDIPVVQLALPALFNGLIIGWELSVYIGGAFAINALYVALGELGVAYTLGLLLYTTIKRRRIPMSE